MAHHRVHRARRGVGCFCRELGSRKYASCVVYRLRCRNNDRRHRPERLRAPFACSRHRDTAQRYRINLVESDRCHCQLSRVGGSVLTVPLLRRKGIAMARAAALANPLSLPVAAAGTIVYALGSAGETHPGEVGHINLAAAAVLLGGSLPAIALTRRVLSEKAIPDRVHAIMYLVLLGIVVTAMTVTIAW